MILFSATAFLVTRISKIGARPNYLLAVVCLVKPVANQLR